MQLPPTPFALGGGDECGLGGGDECGLASEFTSTRNYPWLTAQAGRASHDAGSEGAVFLCEAKEELWGSHGIMSSNLVGPLFARVVVYLLILDICVYVYIYTRLYQPKGHHHFEDSYSVLKLVGLPVQWKLHSSHSPKVPFHQSKHGFEREGRSQEFRFARVVEGTV